MKGQYRVKGWKYVMTLTFHLMVNYLLIKYTSFMLKTVKTSCHRASDGGQSGGLYVSFFNYQSMKYERHVLKLQLIELQWKHGKVGNWRTVVTLTYDFKIYWWFLLMVNYICTKFVKSCWKLFKTLSRNEGDNRQTMRFLSGSRIFFTVLWK